MQGSLTDAQNLNVIMPFSSDDLRSQRSRQFSSCIFDVGYCDFGFSPDYERTVQNFRTDVSERKYSSMYKNSMKNANLQGSTLGENKEERVYCITIKAHTVLNKLLVVLGFQISTDKK